MANGKTGTRARFFCLIIAIASAGCDRTPPAVNSKLNGLTVRWDYGVLTSGELSDESMLAINQSAGELKDVHLTIKFYREDRQILEEERSWPGWAQGETKRVNVPTDKYKKAEWQGTAIKDGVQVRIEEVYTFEW